MIKGDLALLKGRRFQLWDYWVSLSQLLIRSPHDGQFPNIDLRFAGVDYLDVSSSFKEIEILTATESEVSTLRDKLGRDFWRNETVFVLCCEGQHHYVVAAHLVIEENWHRYMMSSLDYPWKWEHAELPSPERFGNPEEIEQTRTRWAGLTQALSTKIMSAMGERPEKGMGAFEVALLLEDCLRILDEHLADASGDTIRRAFSLLNSLLEELVRPNAREKALLDRSALLVEIQYEIDKRANK